MSTLVTVDIAPGELVDKITILEIKLERITGEAKLQNVRTEWTVLTQARDANLPRSTELDDLTARLKEVNERKITDEDMSRANKLRIKALEEEQRRMKRNVLLDSILTARAQIAVHS